MELGSGGSLVENATLSTKDVMVLPRFMNHFLFLIHLYTLNF
jgi:hypothetical protein